MRRAPFGDPVVPLVYWMSARSSVSGRGCEASKAVALTTSSQAMVPEVGAVSASRPSRAFRMGRCSASRVCQGIAVVRSTEMRESTRTSSVKPCTVAATLDHTMACFAP